MELKGARINSPLWQYVFIVVMAMASDYGLIIVLENKVDSITFNHTMHRKVAISSLNIHANVLKPRASCNGREGWPAVIQHRHIHSYSSPPRGENLVSWRHFPFKQGGQSATDNKVPVTSNHYIE